MPWLSLSIGILLMGVGFLTGYTIAVLLMIRHARILVDHVRRVHSINMELAARIESTKADPADWWKIDRSDLEDK